jgi:hypothetical protein
MLMLIEPGAELPSGLPTQTLIRPSKTFVYPKTYEVFVVWERSALALGCAEDKITKNAANL